MHDAAQWFGWKWPETSKVGKRTLGYFGSGPWWLSDAVSQCKLLCSELPNTTTETSFLWCRWCNGACFAHLLQQLLIKLLNLGFNVGVPRHRFDCWTLNGLTALANGLSLENCLWCPFGRDLLFPIPNELDANSLVIIVGITLIQVVNNTRMNAGITPIKRNCNVINTVPVHSVWSRPSVICAAMNLAGAGQI